uniref:Evasin n=1 Tax=Rhipicephalus zambeziensis TaxID=60191 RepID=A0A224YCD7_9ACAR
MAFKACITIITAVYAVQLLYGACGNSTDPNVDDTEYDYGDATCLYSAINIPNNDTLALNCTLTCFNGTQKAINESLPCVNATTPSLNSSVKHYNCTKGYCSKGICYSNHTVVLCWLD